MSRYRIPHDQYEIVVGWDNPLQTYFAQIIDGEDSEGEDNLILWVGAMPGKLISTVDALQETLSPYGVTIPENIREELQTDYAERTEPTPMQKFGAKIVEGIFDEYYNKKGKKK